MSKSSSSLNEKTKTSSATDECAAHTSEGVDCVRLSGGGYGRCLVTSKNGTFVGPSYTHAMSRVAAIYDIHGNLAVLQAVLDEVRAAHVDIVVVGGDLVPGPMPRETVARVRSIDVPVFFIQGNGDREVVVRRRGASNRRLPEPVQDVLGWSAEQLTPEDVAFMAGWPASKDLPVAGLGRVMFCHATLRNDTEIFTRDTPEAEVLPMFPAAVADVIVCGHTHMQFDRPAGGRRIVNAGSVGMPFGEPGAIGCSWIRAFNCDAPRSTWRRPPTAFEPRAIRRRRCLRQATCSSRRRRPRCSRRFVRRPRVPARPISKLLTNRSLPRTKTAPTPGPTGGAHGRCSDESRQREGGRQPTFQSARP